MLKKILAFIIFCLGFGFVQGQTMEIVFGKMPNDILFLLDSIKRQDLMDLYKDNKTAQVLNTFEGLSTLRELSDDHLLLEMGNTKYTFALLPMINHSKLLCVIQTVCAPACDSKIKFYSTDWKAIDSKQLFSPAGAEWFLKDASDSDYFETMLNKSRLDISMMEYRYDKEQQTINQYFNSQLMIDKDERKKIESILKSEPKIFYWTSTRFE